VLHNRVLADFSKELRKNGGIPSDPCAWVDSWFTAPEHQAELNARMPRGWRDMLASHQGKREVCTRVGLRSPQSDAEMRFTSRVVEPTAPEEEVQLGPEATAMVNDVQAATSTASNPTELAGMLSPILDASLTLDTMQGGVVQAVISVAQSSSEHWYANDYAEMMVVAEASANDLNNQCSNGQLEGSSYDAPGGVTYICMNGSWLASVGGVSPGRPRIILTRSERALVCDVPKWVLYAGIAVGDVASGIVGGVRGGIAGPLGALAMGAYYAVRGSASTAWGMLAVHLFCAMI
jgi:hypothetical protein